MPPDGFAEKQIQAKERTKKSDKYKDIVLEYIKAYIFISKIIYLTIEFI